MEHIQTIKTEMMLISGSLRSFRALPHVSHATTLKDPVEEKLGEIGKFRTGWHFGEGLPMRPESIKTARKLHKVGKALGLADGVFPHEDGDVSIMFKAEEANQYLEILCLPDMKFSLTLEEGRGHPFTLIKENEDVTFEDVLKELQSFAKTEILWLFSGLYTQTNTIMILNDLHQSASATPQDMLMEPLFRKANAESVSSIPHVYYNASPLNLSASILRPNTVLQEWSAVLLSIGNYPPYLPSSKLSKKELKRTPVTET